MSRGENKHKGPTNRSRGDARGKEAIEKWLGKVSAYLSVGMPFENIVRQLAADAIEDQALGRPPGRATVARYIAEVERRWKAERSARMGCDLEARLTRLRQLSLKMENRGAFSAQANIERQITDLMGIEPPKRHEHSGPGGNPLQIELSGATDAELEVLEGMASRLTDPARK